MIDTPEKPEKPDWMAGLGSATDEVARSPWEPLYRWRRAIIGLAVLGFFEWLYVRWGFGTAALGLAGLAGVAFVARIFLGGGEIRRRAINLTAAGALGVVAGIWGGPTAGLLAAVLAWITLSVRVWRLKIRHMMVFLVFVAIGIRATQILGDSVLALLLLLLPPLGVGLAFLIYRQGPAIEREGLVDMLAIAARSRLPLGPAVAALAALGSSGTRRRLNSLARRLDEGQPLSLALRLTPGALPREAETLARFELPGLIPIPALEQAVTASEARRRDPISWAGLIAYPLTVLAFVGLALLFMHFAIAPRLSSVYTDFGRSGPGSIDEVFHRLARRIGIRVAPDPIPWIDFAMLLTAVMLAASLIALLLRKQGIRVRLPWFRLRDEREIAAVLRGLSVGLDSGEPLPRVLGALCQATSTPWLSRRLARASERIAGGTPWPEALRRQGLFSNAEAALMGAAGRVGNPGWALRELAAGRERRAADRLRVTSTLLRTFALAAIGAIVLAAALAYFFPIMRIIEHLAEDWG